MRWRERVAFDRALLSYNQHVIIMENFVNMGRQFLQNQGQNGQQNGQENGNGGGFNIQNLLGNNSQPQQGQGNNNNNGGSLNLQSIIGHATQHEEQQGGNGGSKQDLFGKVANMLQQKQSNGQINDNVNESQLMSAFHKVTGGSSASDQEIGEAAAVNAIKSHFSGGGQQSQGGIDSLIGKAMASAGSLASKQGGSEQNAMNHASETVMKLVMKHKLKSMFGMGGYDMNDASQLMGLLS